MNVHEKRRKRLMAILASLILTSMIISMFAYSSF